MGRPQQKKRGCEEKKPTNRVRPLVGVLRKVWGFGVLGGGGGGGTIYTLYIYIYIEREREGGREGLGFRV